MKVLDFRKYLAVGALMLISGLAVNGASPKGTAVVKDVSFKSDGQSLEVRITATRDAEYTYFELKSPLRLVIDFHGIPNQIGFRERQVDAVGVERVRTSFFSDSKRKATRVVFDLAREVRYRVQDNGGGVVRILFSRIAEAPPGKPPANLTAGPPIAPALEEPSLLSFPPVQVQLPLLQQIPPPVPVPAAPPLTAPEPPVAAAPIPPAAPVFNTAPSQQTAVQILPTPTPQYTGEIISLDLKDVDLKDFFRLIGEISGLNIILDPNVSGSLTVRLVDVPWDQALDVVLRNYQLSGQLQGNVLRIATNSRLQAEEAERRTQLQAEVAVAELVTRPIILNYSRADAVATTLRTLLTARGNIIQDARRNALIITDVPSQFERIEDMVQFLDQPAQQVEIEARLLSANKSFSRDIGNQLGLLLGARTGNVLTGATGASSPFPRTPPPRAQAGGGGVPLVSNFPTASTSGLAFLIQPGGDILLDELIMAAEARGTARLISRPKVTTQNNQTATVQQGTQIPVQTNVNNTVTVQFLPFTLALQVTPQITDAGTILLNVNVDNSQPDFARAVNGIPSIATQSAQTQVLIPDGGTAVIGGILIDSDSLNIRQVPGLGSIPVIGHLFKSSQTAKSTTELIFFITPRIKPPNALILEGPPPDTPPGN